MCENPNRQENFKSAKILFGNYNRMITEIAMLKQSIAYYSKNIANAVNEDISNASMAHSTENNGSFNPNSAGDNKVANIACNIGKYEDYYTNEISKLKYKLNIFTLAVESINIFMSYVDEEKAEVLKLHFIDKQHQPFAIVAETMNRSERGVKLLSDKAIAQYAASANWNLNLAVDLLGKM